MHIPENYLSPQTCAVLTAAMVPVWTISIRQIKKQLPAEKLPMLGVGAAFSFLGMMFNLPLPGGTTGHAVGGTLIAAALGPYASCIAVSIALLVQALLFGDGGILSFGANCFNMAFVLPFVGYAVYSFLRKHIKGSKKDLIAAGIGSYLAINAAALCAAIEFGIQPLLFRDAAGNSLYCPYSLSVSVPAMMIGHLTVFGLAEIIFTVLIYAFLKNAQPSMFAENTADNSGKLSFGLKALLAALMAAAPLGLLAEGTAWGEWGVEEIAATGAGYTPSGMLNGFSLETLLPDYSVAGMPDAVGYIICAILGVSILIIFFKLISAFAAGRRAGTAD